MLQVRLMRACRVVRLFGRFPELKKMVTAVSASILAMMHSFFIFILVMAICEHRSRRCWGLGVARGRLCVRSLGKLCMGT